MANALTDLSLRITPDVARYLLDLLSHPSKSANVGMSLTFGYNSSAFLWASHLDVYLGIRVQPEIHDFAPILWEAGVVMPAGFAGITYGNLPDFLAAFPALAAYASDLKAIAEALEKDLGDYEEAIQTHLK